MSATDVPKMNLENHIVPVTDVDRAKGFYARLGWRLDDDVAPMEGLRFVQFTPPGSAASITFGLGLNTAAPGSTQGTLVGPGPCTCDGRGGPSADWNPRPAAIQK